ncbi:MAG: hypothetical protein VX294_05060 [Candidatus Latescibacterota bacterium]|nr:hypothetical protein [Candidatus Latescibacterota bacterium]
MQHTLELGSRIELVPMDQHFNDISIGLYKSSNETTPFYLVHTYSKLNGSKSRINKIIENMRILGGMEIASDLRLYFRCNCDHRLAVRRLFLESCKINPEKTATPYPLHITDKKSNCKINVEKHQDGEYKVSAAEPLAGIEKRTATVARGLQKLGELVGSNTDINSIAFPCRQSHDALIAILLVRAPNVRAAIREADELASRGQLIAPSAQK